MLHIEQQIQMAVVQYLRLRYPDVLFTISPGGLLTNTRVGGKAKRLGYQKGCPDIIIFKPNKKYHGLFIELKRDTKSRLQYEQKVWLDKLNELGYKAVCCPGIEEAIAVIDQYFKDLI